MSYKIPSELFQPAYMVYIVKVHFQDNKYLYVGQTGDVNYKSARPLFARLGGHFQEAWSSTQNQIYKHLAMVIEEDPDCKIFKKDGERKEAKNRIREAMSDLEVEVNWAVSGFFDLEISLEEHRKNRKPVVEAENFLIQELKKAGKEVINKTNYKAPNPEKFEETFQKDVLALREWAFS